MIAALTGEELLTWLNDTSQRWTELLSEHPEALDWPCDIREAQNVAQLLQHMVAVELRYAERLADQPETDYGHIASSSVQALAQTHERAVAMLQPLLLRDDAFWDELIVFTTRSAGTLQAKRRVVLVHLAMHSIRHYAQLATLVRQHGIQPGWHMDYLFQETTCSRRPGRLRQFPKR